MSGLLSPFRKLNMRISSAISQTKDLPHQLVLANENGALGFYPDPPTAACATLQFPIKTQTPKIALVGPLIFFGGGSCVAVSTFKSSPRILDGEFSYQFSSWPLTWLNSECNSL